MSGTSVTGRGTGSSEGKLPLNFNLDYIRKVFIKDGEDLTVCIDVDEEGRYILKCLAGGQIKVSPNDPVGGYLGDKIVAGAGTSLAIVPGPNGENLVVSSTATGGNGQVKIFASDQVLDFLGNKLVAGTNVNFTFGPGPDQNLVINAVVPPATDGQVKINSSDQILGYLASKLVAGSNITLTVGPGPDENLTIDAAGTTGQVKINSSDQVLDYLANKLVAGSNIFFTFGPGPDENLVINATGGGGGSGSTLTSSIAYSCPATVALQDLVYFTGSNAVDKANASAIATAPGIGFVTQKPTTTTCFVAYAGEVTGFSGLVAGQIYFLDTTAGLITTTAPSASNQVLQRVGVAASATMLIASIDANIILL
jgi:hypothetical protein